MRGTLLSIFLVLTCCLAACGDSKIELLTAMPESEANTVVSVLSAASIESSKTLDKNGTVAVRVSTSQQAEALSVLRANGLPRRNFTTLGEVFRKDGIVSSPLEEQARYVYALAQQLEDTLSQLDDVVYVRVLPVLPRKASLSGPAITASAGVFIKYRPSADLSDIVPRIRELVAHSVPELDPSRVSIVTTPADEDATGDVQIAQVQAKGSSWGMAMIGGIVAFSLGIVSALALSLSGTGRRWLNALRQSDASEPTEVEARGANS